jgi:hypothetical protein
METSRYEKNNLVRRCLFLPANQLRRKQFAFPFCASDIFNRAAEGHNYAVQNYSEKNTAEGETFHEMV